MARPMLTREQADRAAALEPTPKVTERERRFVKATVKRGIPMSRLNDMPRSGRFADDAPEVTLEWGRGSRTWLLAPGDTVAVTSYTTLGGVRRWLVFGGFGTVVSLSEAEAQATLKTVRYENGEAVESTNGKALYERYDWEVNR